MKKNTPSNIINPQPLRMLIVEDSEDDALLVLRGLKKGGYSPLYERVETSAAMKKALKEKQWDIILCDYKMPQFSGKQAIALLKETNIDIPLIIVSGTIGEETALECMRSGAHDYVMKDNLSRLCPAIARELGEAEVRTKQRKAENALCQSEEKYRTILDEMADVYFEVDLAGNFTFFNDAIYHQVGYSREELIGTSFRGRVAKEDITNLYNAFGKIYSTGKLERSIFYKFLHKNGTMGSMEAAVFPLQNQKGEIVGFRGIARDITERKQTEEVLRESEEKYRLIAENTADLITVTDMNLHFTYISPSIMRTHGYTVEEAMNLTLDQLMTPGSLQILLRLFEEEMKLEAAGTADPGRISIVQVEEYKKDGSIIWLESSISAQRDKDNKPIGILTVNRDITERKRAEDALKNSEGKYRSILENIEDGYYEVDIKGNFTFFNDSMCLILGYSPEEMMGMNNRQFTDKENANKLFKTFNEVYRTGEPAKEFDWQIIRKDGTKRHIEVSVSLQKNLSGQPIGFQGIARDITERKRAEGALRESEKYFKEITENSSDIIIITDKKGNIKYCSRSTERLIGYKPDELIGRNVIKLIHPDDVKRAVGDFGKAILAKDYAIPNAFRIVHKDGSERYFEGLGKNLLDNPAVAGFIMNVHDITERKQAYEALRESEERYRTLVENASDIVYRTDDTGHFTFVNSAALHITGYDEEEFVGKHFRKFIRPDMRDEAINFLVSQMENRVQNTYYEFLILTKEGHEVWLGQNTQLVVEDGHVQGFQAVARDITGRKRAAEEALREKHFSDAVIDSLPGIFYLIDKKKQFSRFNKNMADVTGYSAHELSLFSATDIIKKEDRKLIKSKIEEAFNNGSAVVEASILTKDGREIPYYFTAISIAIEDNIFIAGMGIDIIDRKKMEETLRKSEERYRTILDEMEDAYFEVDLAGNYTFLNDACCRHLGYSREELIGTNFRDQMVKEELEKVYKAFGKIYITGKPERNIFCKMIRKDGTIGFAEMTGFPLENQQGEVIGFRGVGRDVTESKRAEDALRESEALYHLLAEHMTDIVWMMNMDLNVTWLSPSAMKARGFSVDEIVVLPLDRQLTPDSLGKAVNWLGKLMRLEKDGLISETDGILSRELEFYCKDGHTIVLDCIFQFIRDEQGKATGILAEGRDITARKRVEEELKQSFERLRKALGATVQSISTIVEMKDPYTAGHQQRVSDLARSIATEMGLSADQRDFIRTASAIHDIGKISIPAEILSKPTKLTDLEFNLIKTHSQSGHDILKDIEFPWPVADVVLQHHERMNGSGYPQGLKGDDILLEARIMAVADVVEAIGSHRPYRPSLGIDFALEEISRNKGVLYDADVVDACLKLFREKGYTLVFKKS